MTSTQLDASYATYRVSATAETLNSLLADCVAYARQMSRADTSQSDDIAQEAAISAWQSLDSYSGRSRFSTWFSRIVHRRIIDMQRVECRYVELPEIAQHALCGDGDPDMHPYLPPTLPVALRATYGDLYRLLCLPGATVAGVADELGISEIAARSKVQRLTAEIKKTDVSG